MGCVQWFGMIIYSNRTNEAKPELDMSKAEVKNEKWVLLFDIASIWDVLS